MTAKREKDSSDFDLEQFVDLFDTALSSDNPAVKRALKNLLMIATLVDSDITPEQRVKGPLRRLVDDLRDTNHRIDRLQEEQAQRNYTRTMPGGGSGGGGMIPTPWTGPMFPGPSIAPGTGTPQWPPGTIIGSGYTLSSSTAVDDQYLPDQTIQTSTLTSQKIQSMLDMLDRFDQK